MSILLMSVLDCGSYKFKHGNLRDEEQLVPSLHDSLQEIQLQQDTQIITPFQSKQINKHLEQIFLSANRVRLASGPYSALQAAARPSALILEIGHQGAQTAAAYQYTFIPQAQSKTILAGAHISKELQRLINVNDEVVDAWKEQFSTLKSNHDQIEVCLPGTSKSILLKEEQKHCAEILFNDNGPHAPKSLQHLVVDCIKNCDIDIRNDLYSNIVICGGTSLIPGITERLQKEIQALAPPKAKVKVIATKERGYLAWAGASFLLDSSDVHWIAKKDFDEQGESILSRSKVPI
jgi:actin-related protein